MKMQCSCAFLGVAFLFATSGSQAQVSPGRVPASKAGPVALFPRQAEAFGVTIQVDEVGFAPLSRMSDTLDSSPHFFMRWSTPNKPQKAWVRFLGLGDVKPHSMGRLRGMSPQTAPVTTILDSVSPQEEKVVATWEVADPNRTSEDDGSFSKTYDFTSGVPTRENPVITPGVALTTVNGTQITLQRVECNYNAPFPITKATFLVTRAKSVVPDNMRADIYTSAGLESISDGTGKVFKPTSLLINPDAFMQMLSPSSPVTYSVEGVPDSKATELHLKLVMNESSTEFRNEAKFKRASIEIPVAALISKSDMKPTPSEMAPSTVVQQGEIKARLDGKFEKDRMWNGVIWVTPPAKDAETEGPDVQSTYTLESTTATGADGTKLEMDYLSQSRPTGHNDGTFADANELSFRIGLAYNQDVPDKGDFSVVLKRSDSKEQPVRFVIPPIAKVGTIVALPPSPEPQDAFRPQKIAVLDAALKSQLVENSSIMSLDLPLGSIVLVEAVPTEGNPAFALRSISVGGQKIEANIQLVFDGDRLAGNQPGPFQTVIYSTPSPLPVNQALTLEGALVQRLGSTSLPTLEFKEVPLKTPKQ